MNVERRSYDYPSLKYVSQLNVSTAQLLPGRLRLEDVITNIYSVEI